MLLDDLRLIREALLDAGVPTDPVHPRRMALDALDRSINGLRIEGSPSECGAQVFSRHIIPTMHNMGKFANPNDIASFYGGLLMSILGSMSADFGQKQTARMVGDLLEIFVGEPITAVVLH
jgi:hypothetical protein